MSPKPIKIEITCTKCRKRFYKESATLVYVDRVWAGFSHCDACETKDCHACFPMQFRKKPFDGLPAEKRWIVREPSIKEMLKGAQHGTT
jgi:hypothetical protein